MKKLLVAVDGSGAAQRALEKAIALARMSPDTSIHLVHAHEEPDVYGEIAVYVPWPKMEELQRAHSEAVLAGAEQAAGLKDSGVRYTKEVLIGPIGETIARHGRSTVGDLFMGSVAMKVLHLTRLPVLLVR